MKIAAIALNVVLFGFTLLVRFTDGPAAEPAYVLFGLLLVLLPLINVGLIFRDPRRRSSGSTGSNRTAERVTRAAGVALNVVLIGFACWAIADQYPHPAEPGFLEYVFVVVLTPILSVIAIVRPDRKAEAKIQSQST